MNLTFRKYSPLWNKYRPAILKMMLASVYEPQHYKLMKHEFEAMDGKKRNSFGFHLLVSGSAALNNIKDSETALDFLNMLQLSRKGSELLAEYAFEIELDKQFMLHISQMKQENKKQSLQIAESE